LSSDLGGKTMGGSDVTVFVCISCNGSDVGAERQGRILFDAVTVRAAGAVTVTPVECLAVCKRPCTIALAGEGKWTYVVGDLNPERDADDVIAACMSYAATTDGIVPWRQRPQSFRKGVVSRVPPIGFRVRDPGT
jgi:predicted metal-binding protein